MENATSCVDCGCVVRRQGSRGPVPKRCADCTKLHKRNDLRQKDWRLRRRPDVPCVGCGKLCWRDSRFSLAEQPPRTCRACRARPDALCETCGTQFKAKKNNGKVQRFCSKPCKGVASRSQAPKALAPSAPWVMGYCAYCGDPFTTRKSGSLYCSMPCRRMRAAASRQGRDWSTSTELIHDPKPRRTFTPEHTSSGRIFVSGECRRCGDLFTIIDQLENRYCSTRCARADGKDRRRARKREAFVENVYRAKVFERDGWRCQICRRKVDRLKAAPHPKAPTLDHIIPLAKGGTHEPRNAQLACFTCNSRKGDRFSGDQLLLIG